MEHVEPLDRSFSWRGAALAVTLVLVVVLAILGGVALIHRMGATTRPAAASNRVPKHAAIPLRARSRTSVLVLNGNGTSGVAGDEATRLLALGYRHAVPTDAPSEDYARSLVLFRPGWRREAERLAREVGVRAVAPLDGRLAPTERSFRLVVILGAN